MVQERSPAQSEASSFSKERQRLAFALVHEGRERFELDRGDVFRKEANRVAAAGLERLEHVDGIAHEIQGLAGDAIGSENVLLRIEPIGEGQRRTFSLRRPAEIADDRSLAGGDGEREPAAIDAGVRIARLPLPEGFRINAKACQGLVRGIEALRVGFWIEPCPPLLAGLGGTVRRTVIRAASLRPQEFLVQFFCGLEGSLPIFAGVSPRERHKFDLIAAGGALEAIERARLLPPAVITDDEAVDALAKGTRPFPLPRAPRLQSGDAKKVDDLIHS